MYILQSRSYLSWTLINRLARRGELFCVLQFGFYLLFLKSSDFEEN